MAVNMYLKITGQKQGWIKGSATVKAHKDWIAVHSFSWSIVSPRDPASGLPTGKRQHKALDLVVDGTSASPALFQALAENENLTSARLDFAPANTNPRGVLIGLNRSGVIKLTNASLSSFKISASQTDAMPLEEITLTYQTLELDSGSTSFADDWTGNVG
jgi:type VI secretion system secreted protein Hcp